MRLICGFSCEVKTYKRVTPLESGKNFQDGTIVILKSIKTYIANANHNASFRHDGFTSRCLRLIVRNTKYAIAPKTITGKPFPIATRMVFILFSSYTPIKLTRILKYYIILFSGIQPTFFPITSSSRGNSSTAYYFIGFIPGFNRFNLHYK